MLGLSLQQIIPTVVLILFLMWMLNLLLYRPMLKNMDQRKDIIDGDVRNAEEANRKLKQLQEEYEQALLESRKDAKAAYNKAHEEALGREKEILDQAQQKADKFMAKAMTDLEKDIDTAKEDLRSISESLSRDISAKILGRSFS